MNLQNLVTGLVLLLLGFGLGWLFSPADQTPVPAATPFASVPSLPPPDPDAEPPRRRRLVEGVEPDVTEAHRAALEDVLARRDAFERIVALAELLQGLDESAVPALRAILKDPRVQPGGAEIELLVRYWASHEPEYATLWAGVAPPAYQALAIGPAVEAWASVDPKAAAETALQATMYMGAANQAAQRALVRGWYISGEPGLTDYIFGLGDSIESQRALSELIRVLIDRSGSEAATEWVRSLPAEPVKFKLSAYRQLSSELTTLDIDAALAICEEVCDTPYGDGVRRRIARWWAMEDGEAALVWLSSEPPGQERDVAVRNAVDSWIKSDREAASAWLTSQWTDGVDPWLQPAIPVYVRHRSQTNPADALRWAGMISDEKERTIWSVRAARLWRKQDETAAEAWLMNSDLSEELRESSRQSDMNAEIPFEANS